MVRTLIESFKYLETDFANCFKALWASNALDGKKEYRVSERLMSLVGEKIKAFCDQLKKKKSPKNLKKLLKLITPLKGVRLRDRNQKSTSPINKGFELFDCDGKQIQNDRNDVKHESYDKSDNNKDRDAATTTSDNKKKQLLKHCKPVILADLCKKISDLKGDAMFNKSWGIVISCSNIKSFTSFS